MIDPRETGAARLARRRAPARAAWACACLLASVSSILLLRGASVAGPTAGAAGAPGTPGAARAAGVGDELVVFEAASLRDAFARLVPRFEKENAPAKVITNAGGTQELRTQIEHGAAADVFASA